MKVPPKIAGEIEVWEKLEERRKEREGAVLEGNYPLRMDGKGR